MAGAVSGLALSCLSCLRMSLGLSRAVDAVSAGGAA